MPNIEAGTTATVLILLANKKFIVNIGDSRVLTDLTNPKDTLEGHELHENMHGELAVRRSFGDFYMERHNYWEGATPQVQEIIKEQPQPLYIASDGVEEEKGGNVSYDKAENGGNISKQGGRGQGLADDWTAIQYPVLQQYNGPTLEATGFANTTPPEILTRVPNLYLQISGHRTVGNWLVTYTNGTPSNPIYAPLHLHSRHGKNSPNTNIKFQLSSAAAPITAAFSRQHGPQRSINPYTGETAPRQDAFSLDKFTHSNNQVNISAVYDGHGPQAEDIAHYVSEYFPQLLKIKIMSEKQPITPELLQQFIKDAVTEITTKIWNTPDLKEKAMNAGTTLAISQ